ncbi:MAG: Nif3-like dinuclear metal center hexameric protein [Solirubrobacterales bacterium]|nr:Nif3-like dinuclear metal center hexameric protein [Solirubrobacterales bacterium]
MVALQTVIDRLDEILNPDGWSDYAPNGLQVPGPSQVHRVVTGVSAHSALFEHAVEREADLVLVHHGLFWKGEPLGIDAVGHRRLKLLFDHDIALAAYHLPLDAHLEHGNNARLAAELGAEHWTPAFTHGGGPIGVIAEFPAIGISVEELVRRVATATLREDVLAFTEGPERVKRVGICCGAAAGDLPEAVALGCDAFLTGEPAERCAAIAREYGISFLAAGHHATERLGVQRLGEILATEFGLQHEYAEIFNPI